MTSQPTGPPDEPAATLPVDRVVFGIGAVAVLGVVAWGIFAEDSLGRTSSTALGWVLHNFGWLFVVAADVFLALTVLLAFSRFGRIRLGRDDDEPEFSTLAWVAMMFSAGMGIGLMFYGVGEPLQLFAAPQPGSGLEPQSAAAAQQALEFSLFHWTLHPWAIYAVGGLALAYTTFRKGRGNRISAAFVPLIGERGADGWPGRAIDLLAVFATVFGSATSLGLGALQVADGLGYVSDVSNTERTQLVIIASLSAAFVLSAFSGVHKGVKWLSTANVVLASLIMLFVFVVGPTVFVLDAIPSSVGGYLSDLLAMSTQTGAFTDESWLGSWTIFYWAWWLSWAPFVGTFIARISRGRTVREFLLGVLLVPSGATVIWFCVMGGTAIRLDSTGAADLVETIPQGAEASLFEMLRSLPGGTVTSVIAVLLVMTFFITSADSASLVLGSLSSRGSLHPRTWLVVVWGVLMGGVAAALLLAGGLTALQNATILVALPFVGVMLLLCVALVKELRTDPAAGPSRFHPAHGLRDAVRVAVGEAMAAARNGNRRPPNG
ncbi:choline/carnitine/betaine transport [Streptomyces sp. TLI_053]|uniref:BCCT family transporter n=1 Tax=Streptomyces sp. TLI_053 TaxID=1855352 RepID=UPI00087A65CC|nr:BCCT family transporter [Streptomyces sp. TLI_053]SDT30698.1 choline/carnitine/betaine transport [Streptomyces sp. TLI_053]